MEKTIDDPRIICGILSELSTGSCLLEIHPEGSDEVCFTELELQIAKPFKNSKIKLLRPLKRANNYQCHSVIASKKIMFNLDANEENFYHLPSTIHVIESRTQGRISNLSNRLIAEVRTHKGLFLGYVNDMSQKCISLIAPHDTKK
ncbi:MAG: hypothetical protein HQK53_13715, partial [Oligoflexia bacterium]|nr:hypothetical protein [Oligoflexia bacterium]